MTVLRSAKEYVQELALDEDQEEEVVEEMNNVASVWAAVIGKEFCDIAVDVELVPRLMKKLGATYSESFHGVELRKLAEPDGLLKSEPFFDWYVRWIFKNDEDDEDEELPAPKPSEDSKAALQEVSQNWSAVKWSVAPTGEEVAGTTWKCAHCRIVNKWQDAACAACDSAAPHADTLAGSATATAGPTVQAFTFGFSGATVSSKPVMVTPAITTTGFTFGVASPAVTATTADTSSSSTSSASPASPMVFTFGSTSVEHKNIN